MYDTTTVDRVFTSVLGPHNLGHLYNRHELHFRPTFIYEHTYANNLSDPMLDSIFPRKNGPIELNHYTSLEGFRGIIGSGTLRLYTMLKRLGEGEFDTFAAEHKLTGYFTSLGTGGRPYYQDLMGDLFYSSFTLPGGVNAADMWDIFSNGGGGVRFLFRVTPGAAELRPIHYQAGKPTLLTELNDALQNERCPPFVPKTISKIGAFYLPLGFATENELRLLIKRHREYFALGMNEAENDGRYEFWPLPIDGSGKWASIELLQVAVGPNCDRAEVEKILNASKFAGVQVV